MTSSLPKIILDTDPGGDDILALLWLLSFVRQGAAELVAVTTAAGNVAAERTFTNASQVLGLTGFSSIAVGRAVQERSPVAEDASHIHGSDGMGNLANLLPTATHNFDTAPDAAELLIDRLRTAPGEITLAAIAPLTNLAAAETKCPGILKSAKELVIMGGAFAHRGNVTPQAEFNIWYDPDAAETVFHSRDDLIVLPLDVTSRLRFTPEMAATAIAHSPDVPLCQFLPRLCDFMVSTALGYRETDGISAFLVHDAAAIGYIFYPELFQFQRTIVQIETQGKWTRGMTVMGDRQFTKTRVNAWTATQVNQPVFFCHLLEDLKQLIQRT